MSTFGTTKMNKLDKTRPVSVALTKRQCDYLTLYQETHPEVSVSSVIRKALDDFIAKNPPETLIPSSDEDE